MSPRRPSTDPRIIRTALDYAETHTRNATADHFGLSHHSIQKWIEYRAANHSAWPTEDDIAAWDADASRRAKLRRQKHRYEQRRHSNGGQHLMQPPHGTIRRLQALCAIGWTQVEIAARLGVCQARVSRVIRLTRVGVLTKTARTVAELYDELSMVAPVGPAATRARAAAMRKGWAPPLAWDDDTIDDPNATPQGLTSTYEHIIDEAAIERRILGDRTVRLHKGETAEVVRRLLADGWSQNDIARHTGLKPERYITRDTEELAA